MEQTAALNHGCCERRGCQREDVRRHAGSAHAAAGLQRRADVDGPVQDRKRACRRTLEHARSLGLACLVCLQRVHENVRYVKLENSSSFVAWSACPYPGLSTGCTKHCGNVDYSMSAKCGFFVGEQLA